MDKVVGPPGNVFPGGTSPHVARYRELPWPKVDALCQEPEAAYGRCLEARPGATSCLCLCLESPFSLPHLFISSIFIVHLLYASFQGQQR